MTVMTFEKKNAYLEGMKDAVPIGLGYFAVALSVGISASLAGLSPLQAFTCSLLCNASAGEYAGMTVIQTMGSLSEMALITLIANARYLLMSCAMSARVEESTSTGKRCLMAFDLTDELFAMALGREGMIEPSYYYGGMSAAMPGWALGTLVGCTLGNSLPAFLVNALSVSLFGMFISVFIPQAKKEKAVLYCVIVSFACSALFAKMNLLSEGMRTIVLTVAISSVAAVLFPKEDR